MRLFLILAVCLMPLAAVAQGVWERPDAAGDAGKKVKEQKAEKPNPDAKYLAGAVTEVDGKVVWTMDVDVPGKSADQIYALMLQCFTDLTKTENQIEGSCVALVNKAEHMVVATIREWLVFTDKFFALDRTKFYYTLIASCADNHLNVTMSRISYRYEEGREPGGGYVYKAEEWIDDKHALNKKKTRLLPGSAKFRRKTVDRKDYLFSVIREAVLQQLSIGNMTNNGQMTTNQDNTATEMRPRHRRGGGDDRYIVLRNVLNIIFMVGAVVGVVVFYQCGREAGTVIILASMLFKIVECIFRFMK